MKKLILMGCAIIVIIIIILVIGISNLGPLLKNAVNHFFVIFRPDHQSITIR